VRRRACLSLLAAALLAACATTPPPTADEARWTTGRLSVRIDATAARAARSVSAAFELRGDGDGGELRLNSPLGTRMAVARWSRGEAVLTTPDGEGRYDSLDGLARQALGESLPLAALPDWLAGRPWPAAPYRGLDDGFEQLGWKVSLAHRAEGRIEARRVASPAVLVRVQLDGSEP
jgi:outer membrane lipoprotein LolB